MIRQYHTIDMNTKKQNQILKLLQDKRTMSVEEIADYFHLTPTSVRRYLSYLDENKYITRSRGYAHIAAYPFIPDLNERSVENSEEKDKIAKAAMALIKPRESIILDSGSTTKAFADQIKISNIPGISIITNSVPIAVTLAEKYLVMLSGGILQDYNMSLIGPEAEHYFESIVADKVFIGALGVNGTTGLTSQSPFHSAMKKMMIKCSQNIIALMDSTKFLSKGVYTFCDFNQINTIITTHSPKSEQVVNEIAKRGINIIFA